MGFREWMRKQQEQQERTKAAQEALRACRETQAAGRPATPERPAGSGGERISGRGYEWDGQALRLGGGSVQSVRRGGRPALYASAWHGSDDVRRMRGQRVTLPLASIASAGMARGRVQVITVDGREYRVPGPARLAKAITAAKLAQ